MAASNRKVRLIYAMSATTTLCLVLLAASAVVAQPTKSKATWKLEAAMEELKTECAKGTSESASACLKYKILGVLDDVFKKDSFEVSDSVSIVRNGAQEGSEQEEEGGSQGRSDEQSGVLDQLENYVRTHDVLVSLPGSTHLTFSPRNIDQGELNLSLKFDEEESGNAVEARRRKIKKGKLKKILIPIAVFLMLKALTLIPLFIGILGIKSWNALQLSFGSFIVSFALAIFQLCKKLAGDAPPQPVYAHAAPVTGWEAQRSFNDAHNLAYSAYA